MMNQYATRTQLTLHYRNFLAIVILICDDFYFQVHILRKTYRDYHNNVENEHSTIN